MSMRLPEKGFDRDVADNTMVGETARNTRKRGRTEEVPVRGRDDRMMPDRPWVQHLMDAWQPQLDGTIVVRGMDDLYRSNIPWRLNWCGRQLELHVGPVGELRFEVLEYRAKPMVEFRLRRISP